MLNSLSQHTPRDFRQQRNLKTAKKNARRNVIRGKNLNFDILADNNDHHRLDMRLPISARIKRVQLSGQSFKDPALYSQMRKTRDHAAPTWGMIQRGQTFPHIEKELKPDSIWSRPMIQGGGEIGLQSRFFQPNKFSRETLEGVAQKLFGNILNMQNPPQIERLEDQQRSIPDEPLPIPNALNGDQ